MAGLAEVDVVMREASTRIREALAQSKARDRADLLAEVDRRIESAFAAHRAQSLDLYRKGRDGIPEPASVPSGDVDGVVDGAGRGLVGSELGDEVGEVSHDLAPSRSGEGSLGAPRRGAGSSRVEGDTTGGSS